MKLRETVIAKGIKPLEGERGVQIRRTTATQGVTGWEGHGPEMRASKGLAALTAGAKREGNSSNRGLGVGQGSVPRT